MASENALPWQGIFTNECDILILDEPTNHIDSDTVEWLENYLKKFRGAIFMVTHDRYFLDRVTNVILELTGGRLYRHEGNYEVYLENRAAREEMVLATETEAADAVSQGAGMDAPRRTGTDHQGEGADRPFSSIGREQACGQ